MIRSFNVDQSSRLRMRSALQSSDSVPAQLQIPTVARVKSPWREYAEALVLALVLAACMRSFVVQAFKIPSGSMVPTLQVGDYILVNKFAYGLRLPVFNTRLVAIGAPQRDDVVVFTSPTDPSKDFIKRVVGVAGDSVEIRNKQVVINGHPWADPHAYFADGRPNADGSRPRDNYGPVTVPPDHVFVLGDNRDRSSDSRFWGFVQSDNVRGKAVLVYWSWVGDDQWIRWGRLGDSIQ